MTREAKIGLLVALAFLLVIGILLSDHVTTSLRTPSAALADIEDSIADGMAAPGAVPAPQTQPRLPERAAAEQETIPFVLPKQPAISVGRGDPGTNAQLPILDQVAQGSTAGTETMWDNPGIAGSGTQVPEQDSPLTLMGPTDPATALLEDAVSKGAPLELVGGGNAGAQTPVNRSGASAMAGVKEYTIQPGDSLSKITAKFLGRDNPANRAILYSLNPKLKAHPDRIIVGETCQVPASPDAVQNLRAGTTPPASAGPAAERRAAEKPAPARTERPAAPASKSYTVKKGDTLWSIAVKQLGSGARHKEILKLNADKLSSADDIREGMKLKLP